MGQKKENTDFICIVCKRYVEKIKSGGYRNHCPLCLASLHVDALKPGDRLSDCLGVMKACRVQFHTKKGWQIIHQCTKCGVQRANKIDAEADDWNLVVELS